MITDYEDALNGGIVLVHAAVPVNAEPSENHDFSIVDLPEVEQTATILHRRSIDKVNRIILLPTRWIDETGHRSAD